MIFQEFGQTVSESKTRVHAVPSSAEDALHLEAAGQWDEQTAGFVDLGSAARAEAKLSIAIKPRISAAWVPIRKYSPQLYDRPNAQLSEIPAA